MQKNGLGTRISGSSPSMLLNILSGEKNRHYTLVGEVQSVTVRATNNGQGVRVRV